LFTTVCGFLAPALSYLWPVTRSGPSVSQIEAGHADEIPEWGSKKIVAGGSPLIVVRTPGGFKAFSAICTHLGCIVSWDEASRKIACPCHAGFFDVEGKVISGPPPRPLPPHAVSVVDGKILVKV
jgi:cytochrome b6-f complex iron-sulfur subunit